MLDSDLVGSLIIETIWELRAPFFTSFILALVIVGFSQVVEYKKQIRRQYDFYMYTLDIFDRIFEPFFGKKWDQYMPFYNEKCLQSALKILENNDYIREKYENNKFIFILKSILEQLDKIEVKALNDEFIGTCESELCRFVQESKENIQFKFMLDMKDIFVFEDFSNLLDMLLYVVANLRRPWRWDKDSNKTILEILDSYDENKESIKENPYYVMQLLE